MSKLMEIIEKSPNFENGTAVLKFLDTSFTMLTRKIGSKIGANFITAKKGDPLSKELLVSLNQDQLVLKNKLLEWINKYNLWINSIKNKIVGVTNFYYNFSSLVDYTSKYIINGTLADYYMLTEIVNAEKELYEFGYYFAKNHMLTIQNQLKKWSITQPYGSCVNSAEIEFEVRNSGMWSIESDGGLGVTLDNNNKHDKRWIYVSGIQGIALGETRTIIVKADNSPSNNNYKIYALCYFSITRAKLNSGIDDGKIVFKAWGESYDTTPSDGGGDGKSLRSGSYYDKVRSGPNVKSWTGKISPHFNTEDITLAWIVSRVLV